RREERQGRSGAFPYRQERHHPHLRWQGRLRCRRAEAERGSPAERPEAPEAVHLQGCVRQARDPEHHHGPGSGDRPGFPGRVSDVAGGRVRRPVKIGVPAWRGLSKTVGGASLKIRKFLKPTQMVLPIRTESDTKTTSAPGPTKR